MRLQSISQRSAGIVAVRDLLDWMTDRERARSFSNVLILLFLGHCPHSFDALSRNFFVRSSFPFVSSLSKLHHLNFAPRCSISHAGVADELDEFCARLEVIYFYSLIAKVMSLRTSSGALVLLFFFSDLSSDEHFEKFSSELFLRIVSPIASSVNHARRKKRESPILQY